MRATRAMSSTTKLKISQKLSGRKKSEKVKSRIAEGMRRYWATIPIIEEDK